jgi:outer membrane protein assembly factor BamB
MSSVFMPRIAGRIKSRHVRCLQGLILVWLGVAITQVQAGDWPQILGPSRNGTAEDESLIPQVPVQGIEVRWTYEVGEGFAGPAVKNGRVVIHHRMGRAEKVDCLDLLSAKVVWSTDLPAGYQPGINPDAGPRCVPTILDNGKVITYSPNGQLSCLEMKSGKLLWARQLFEEYSGDENYFGAGSTPLVLEDRVLVNIGGRRGNGVVAVSVADGKTLWTSTDEGTSYAAPIAIDWNQKQVALFVTRLNTVGLDVSNGNVLFQVPFGKRGATVNAAMPLETPQGVLLSASYGVGAMMIRPAKAQPKVIWESEDALSSQYFTAVYKDGFLYGIDGREDFQNTRLRCVDAATGQVQWTQDNVPGGHLILAGSQILMVDIEGGLRVFAADPKKFQVVWEAQLHDDPGRSLPALSRGLVLVRTNATAGRGRLTCAVVGKQP